GLVFEFVGEEDFAEFAPGDGGARLVEHAIARDANGPRHRGFHLGFGGRWRHGPGWAQPHPPGADGREREYDQRGIAPPARAGRGGNGWHLVTRKWARVPTFSTNQNDIAFGKPQRDHRWAAVTPISWPSPAA